MPYEGPRPKTLLITSAVPNEGKSTISSNLAITMALSGARTLLIDGDLRRGALREAFGISSKIGFSEVLKQEVNWQRSRRADFLSEPLHPAARQDAIASRASIFCANRPIALAEGNVQSLRLHHHR